MSDPDIERFQGGSRGARDAASLLPFFLVVLLVPPVILIFAKPLTIAGVPLIIVYLFAIWAGAIVTAFFFARSLAKPEPLPPDKAGG